MATGEHRGAARRARRAGRRGDFRRCAPARPRRIGVDFVDRGKHEVKNIERPVHVWAWSPGISQPSSAAGSTALPSAAEEAPAVPDRPSIAVLPFDNMSGDPEQGYFADGITEDIITDLSKVSGLFVIARNSSFAYKGKAPDVRWPRARRALCAGRQRAQGREPHPHQRAGRRHHRRHVGRSATTARSPTSSRCRTRSPAPSSTRSGG